MLIVVVGVLFMFSIVSVMIIMLSVVNIYVLGNYFFDYVVLCRVVCVSRFLFVVDMFVFFWWK